MSISSRFGRRFFTLRMMWPSRRSSTLVAISRHRRSRHRGQQIGGAFGVQELEPRFALAHAPIDAVAPLSDSLTSLVATASTVVATLAAPESVIRLASMTAAIGDDPADFLARVPGLDGILHKVFGNAGTTSNVFDVRVATVEQRLLSGTESLGVQFRVLDASVMGIHEGGYTASAPGGPTIYLRSDLLQDPPDVIRTVLFEELGHHIDVMLNGGLDSPGDEGELFSALVRGAAIGDVDMARILTEDDHGTLVVDGGNVAVEFATVSNATTAVTYTEAGAKVLLQPGLVVGLARYEAIRSVSFAIQAVSAADRVSVSGARSGLIGGTSPFVTGLTVPAKATTGTFYLGPNGASAERWDYSITTNGAFAFRPNGIATARSATATQRLLRAIQYDSTSSNPMTAARTFAWSIEGTSRTTMFGESVRIIAVNNAPTVTVASPSNALVEAGMGVPGTSAATILLTKADVDGTVSYDATWLLANGWSTANAGTSYTKQGTYGTATLTVATNTVAYLLSNTLPATQALAAAARVNDAFNVRVIDNTGATALATAQFAITGSNDVPTVTVASPSNALVEAGMGVPGTSAATILLTKADVDGTVSYDATWLLANGWSTANAGTSYTKQGTYGTATLTVATNTVAYLLSNTLPATQALAAAARVNDAFNVRVIDNTGATALATAQFAITGSNDVPILSGTPVVLKVGAADTPFTVSVADLLVGFTDWEADRLSVANLRCTSAAGTVVHSVVANGSTSYTVSPVAGYLGEATLFYDVLDSHGAVTSAANQFMIPVYTPPTLTVGAATPHPLVEAGGLDNASLGVTASVVAIQRSGINAKVAYDDAFLAANGWKAVTSGFMKAGVYGTALLDTNSDTLTYVLDNTLPATESLRQGQGVDEIFTLQINDGINVAKADAVFHIVGSNDGPRLLGTKASYAPGTENVSYVLRARDLLAGFVDPEGGVLIVRNPATSSGTILNRNDGTYVLTPGANNVGEILVSYDIVDDYGTARRVTASLAFAAVTNAPVIKNFVITTYDQTYLKDQVNVPIVRAIRYETNGTAIYGYADPNTKAIVELGKLGTFDLLQTSWASFLPEVVSWPSIGNTAAGPAEPFGIRNVQGLFNNIAAADQAGWGAAFRPFARLSNADYSNYMTGGVNLSAAYANPFTTIHDGTPRMISQTISSGEAMTRADQISGNTLVTDHLIYQITDLNTGLPKVGGHDQAGIPDPNGLYFKEDFIRNLNTLPGDPSVTGIFNLFGQFFDHGLDQIGKGGNLTNGRASKVYIDLDPSDPLYDPANGVTSIAISRATVANPQAAGPDGKFRTADDIASPGADGLYGTSDDIISPTNPEYQQHTSPYIDQSQTYGSDDTTTNLLRQSVIDPVTGKYTPGMRLFDGNVLDQPWERRNPDGTVTLTKNTLPTLNELRNHIVLTGRADLSWDDTVTNLRVRDGSGQILDLDAATPEIQPKLTDHVFIADWLPRLDAEHLFTDPLAGLPGHTDPLAGFAGVSRPASGSDPAARYVSDYLDLRSGRPTALGMVPANDLVLGEILLRSIGDHYVAGDGRVNENFGLTSMHHVWHENHEWQIDNLIMHIGRSQAADPSKTCAHAWQVAVPGVGGQPRTDAQGNYVDDQGNISWNQEKMFQAATLVNQREYQHVAIDQYARLVSPNIPLFVMYDTSVNADVSLEYSQAAFRFGHSVLRDVIDTLDPNGSLTAAVTHYSLEQAFLTPSGFAKVGPAAIVQGMAQQVGAEIDEFVTPALQQKLLGQPQDLAAINIARGRDLGMPTLNRLREQLSSGMATQLALLQQQQTDYQLAHGFADATLAKAIEGTIALNAGLQPYISWADFGQHMAHSESLPNFVAAYAFNGDVVSGSAIVSLSEGVAYADLTAEEQAAVGVLGWTPANATAKALEFMGASDQGNKSFNQIDAWIGGLAEAHVFLGELGSTFDAVFSDQMSRLINGDRFYYFWSLQFGLVNFTDLNNAVSTEQFADVIARTTGAKHLVGDVMLLADNKVELGENPNSIASGGSRDHKYGDLVQQHQIGIYSGGGASEHANGTITTVGNRQYVYDIRPGVGVNPDGTDAKGYNAHEVISGTDYSDYLLAGDGDDTIWAGDGDDFIDGGAGADHIYGEGGNDVMYGGTVPDFMDGGEGDDIIHGGDDTDVLIGSAGNDRLYGEANLDEMQGGAGDDYMDGGLEADLIFGGEGNDVIIGGEGLDTDYGQAGDDQMFAGSGPDQNFGGYGDDILHGGPGGQNQTLNVDENLGEWGYNVSSFSELTVPLNKIADLNFQNINMASSTPFGQLWVDIQGIEGGRFADQIIGDDVGNWLIGGGGNDVFAGGVGDD
ncbi:MAG: peroxidase family protein, partial [Planctomycetota bacterium]